MSSYTVRTGSSGTLAQTWDTRTTALFAHALKAKRKNETIYVAIGGTLGIAKVELDDTVDEI